MSNKTYIHLDMEPGEGGTGVNARFNGSTGDIIKLMAVGIVDLALDHPSLDAAKIAELVLLATIQMSLAKSTGGMVIKGKTGTSYDMGAIEDAMERMKGEEDGSEEA